MPQKTKYIKLGVTTFCTVAAILLFYDTFFGSRALIHLGKEFVKAARPVLYGAFMAYLLAPAVNFFERPLLKAAQRRRKPESDKRKLRWTIRSLSILLTWAVIGVLLYLLMSVLIPELYKSVSQLVANVESYYNTINGWVYHLLDTYPDLEKWVSTQMNGYYATLESWLTTTLLPQATQLMGVVTGGVFSVVGFVGNLLVGIIVSVYFLATKEICAAHAHKVVHSFFSEERVYWILRGTRKVDSIFSGFVRGKLLDSLIIGILCFIGCSCLRLPYTPLVSVIVGATNVIPFFGPFLGAIPSIFLILLVSPLQALYFALFVLALQQLDGNVIGPMILGDKTGLSSLWVIIAILVGGHFFGVVGMFFGVPVCACLYSAITFYVEMRLQKKGLPVDTKYYYREKTAAVEPKTEPKDGGN